MSRTDASSSLSQDAATGGGAGSVLSGAEALFVGCLVERNNAVGSGGGLFVDGEATILQLNDTKIQRNNAQLFGGGVYFKTSGPAVSFCEAATGIVAFNYAGASGGGVYMNLPPGSTVPTSFACDSVTYNQNRVTNHGSSGTYGLNRATNPHHMVVTKQPSSTVIPSIKASTTDAQYLSGAVVVNDAFGHQCIEISGTMELSFTDGQGLYNETTSCTFKNGELQFGATTMCRPKVLQGTLNQNFRLRIKGQSIAPLVRGSQFCMDPDFSVETQQIQVAGCDGGNGGGYLNTACQCSDPSCKCIDLDNSFTCIAGNDDERIHEFALILIYVVSGLIVVAVVACAYKRYEVYRDWHVQAVTDDAFNDFGYGSFVNSPSCVHAPTGMSF